MPKLTKPFSEFEVLKDLIPLNETEIFIMESIVDETIKNLSPVMEWQAFADGEPDCGDQMQVKILFTSKDWACHIVGIWSKLKNEDGKQLGAYDFVEDKVYEWDKEQPTHYMIIKEI